MVGAAWVLVPLLLLTAAELVRPVYLPRYLLAGLLGLGVLAAAGALAAPAAPRGRRWPRCSSACSLLAAAPLADREPAGARRTRSSRLLAEVQRARRADRRRRPALGDRPGPLRPRASAPELRADLVLPPDDAPADADRVWLVRRLFYGEPEPTDDDDDPARRPACA